MKHTDNSSAAVTRYCSSHPISINSASVNWRKPVFSQPLRHWYSVTNHLNWCHDRFYGPLRWDVVSITICWIIHCNMLNYPPFSKTAQSGHASYIWNNLCFNTNKIFSNTLKLWGCWVWNCINLSNYDTWKWFMAVMVIKNKTWLNFILKFWG